MKTASLDVQAAQARHAEHAAIVDLAEVSQVRSGDARSDGTGGPPASPGDAWAHQQGMLQRARAFAEPLLTAQRFDTGEDALAHADGVSAILHCVGASPSLRAAAYLVYASDYLAQPQDVLTRAFGPDAAALAAHTVKLVQVQRNARDTLADEADAPLDAQQVERIRKMLLAFSRDLRVVLLRLASRLQTLRYYAETKQACPRALARESLQIFAPLANRLGIWQIKWELEDLSFRFLMPDTYRSIAKSLDEKRLERERHIEQVRQELADALRAAGIDAQVQGRPKHIYSIWKKMQGKALSIDKVFDLRALRIIVADVHACYAALSCVHELWQPLPDEFSDYIARPKPNGYQSLHTVVMDAQGRSIEIQIRTKAMHDHAESGVAAHWAYKEAGTKGYAGVQAAGDFESRVAEARKTVLRQLLAWERDLAAARAFGRAAASAGVGRIVYLGGLGDPAEERALLALLERLAASGSTPAARVLAEAGIVGFLLYLGFFLNLLRDLYRVRRSSRVVVSNVSFVSMAIFLVLVSQTVENPYGAYVWVWYALWALFGSTARKKRQA